ncbi:hypothetical protein RYX36_036481 [Vicia faba]
MLRQNRKRKTDQAVDSVNISVLTGREKMMIGASNSITTPNFCLHLHANLATPNAILSTPPPTFSLSLSPLRTKTTSLRILSSPISAVNSGLEALITDSNDISIFLTDVTVVVQDTTKSGVEW